MKVYLLPGLGADKRMYQQQLKIIPGAIVLEHITPVKGESISTYAGRLAALIDTSTPFILVGTSLGGIVSVELSRIIKPEKVILISSVKQRNELPLFIRSMRYLKLHRLISGNTFKRFNKLMVRRLDSRGDSPAARVIEAMTNDVAPEFIEWAVNAVINWIPSENYRPDIVHIHGTNDQLFPISYIKNPIAIKNGSHVMNMTMSYEVNKVLQQVLDES
ncbi:MAG: hypothetical protein JWO06_522 [Bacteroidota bacterium]|nr:hypothetical protein [Bacteroidota bacterium]